MKLTTTRCRITWAKIKSAKPRSGEIPANCCLLSGFTCKRRHTTKKSHKISNKKKTNVIYFSKSPIFRLTAKYKATDCRNEAGQKWIEWKCSNQTAIQELNDTGKHNVEQISVNQFKLLRRIVNVFIVELPKHSS